MVILTCNVQFESNLLPQSRRAAVVAKGRRAG